MLELKDYQQRALNQLSRYLTALDEHKKKKQAVDDLDMGIDYDVPNKAWEELEIKNSYVSWKNGLEEDIPSVCYKVPTGGGKTYLAVHSIEAINLNYCNSRTGFVLWIVPSTQIYRQTLVALRNKEHPYRQILDRSSGGRTIILEKKEYFTPTQVQENLVVMLLMLPSANRAKDRREALRLFQDRSGFELFFPAEDDRAKQLELLNQFPNLEMYGDKDGVGGITLKTSLGNTIRLLKPIMIIDEGHKSYTELARETIKTFNPSFVLELSATPYNAANILVSITGQELNREEMIKLDLNMNWLASEDWKDTLLESHRQVQELTQQAQEYHANGGAYIRPICLIQVERTGKREQRYIHVEDAREFLIENCKVQPEQIAVKSATNDGLEDIDLLSEDCPIQYIITKQALQEGWDCPFAYVLAILSGSTSKRALTQLVGRILRQPYATKTNVKVLDESYVYCYRQSTGDLLSYVKQGFESEGLSDVKNRVQLTTVGKDDVQEIGYRAEFKKYEGKIYLPRFVIQEENEFRPLSYEMDILRDIDWDKLELSALLDVTLSDLEEENLRVGINLADNPYETLTTTYTESTKAFVEIDPVFMTRQLLDTVPNAWVAYEIVEETLNTFRNKYDDEKVGANLPLIIKHLKAVIEKEKDRLAELVFRGLIERERLVFFVQAITDYALPSSIIVKESAMPLRHPLDKPVQMSLWEFEPEESYNEMEKSVALYLDKQEDLLWWYRNMVGTNAYGIQGWRKQRINADFVASDKYKEVYILETKGLHLKGNDDTEYKKSFFDLLNEIGHKTDWDTLSEEFKYKKIEFKLIYEDEWETEINKLFV